MKRTLPIVAALVMVLSMVGVAVGQGGRGWDEMALTCPRLRVRTQTAWSSKAIDVKQITTTGVTYGIYSDVVSGTGIGIFGIASSATGANYGLYGQTASATGHGVYGEATSALGANYGIYGETSSATGYGVYGLSSSATKFGYLGSFFGAYGQYDNDHAGRLGTSTSGVEGIMNGTTGYGVYGTTGSTTGSTYAVYGVAASTAGHGVYGTATATTGINYGVYGVTASDSGWAAFFEGPSGCSQQNYKPLNLSWAEGGTVALAKTGVKWNISAGVDRRMLLDGEPTIVDGARTVIDSMNITFTIPTIADSIDVEIYGVDVIGGATLLTDVGWLGGNNGITGQQTLAVAPVSAAYRSYMVWVDTAVGTSITLDGAALFYRRNTVAVTIP